jgi:predicted site-specific integrase-resolvase
MGKLVGFEIIVANQTLDNDNHELMADFKAIITSFCARLYSQRRGKEKADAIKATLLTDKEDTGL